MHQDFRYGLRMLLRNKLFSLIAVLSLALGIGANTAIFSLLDAVLLKSLPVREPDKLVLFGDGDEWPMLGGLPDRSWELFSYPFYREVRQRNEVFSDVAAIMSITWGIHGSYNRNNEMLRVNVQLVSGSYFTTLGVNPSIGRVFTDDDDRVPGASAVGVVSHAFWENKLGRDPAAVGKNVTIDKVAYTIIGVAPREFFGTTVGQAPDLWVPLAMQAQMPPAYWNGRENKSFQSLHLIARLKNGVTIQQANADVNLHFKQDLHERVGAQPTPEQLQSIQRASIELTPAGSGLSLIRQDFSRSLQILMAVVAVVLLIACANVANLLLARATARQREFAVRLSLGAGRRRLIRQLFTESLLLALLGSAAGIFLAWWSGNLLLVMASTSQDPLPIDVTPNARILGFTLMASLLSTLIFGMAPALRASAIEPIAALKGGKGMSQSALRNRFGKGLVVAQVGLSLLLLVGAGLFVRTLINLQSLSSGYNQQNVLLFQIDTAATGYKDAQLGSLLGEVERKVKGVPGVQAAAFSFIIFNQGQWSGRAYTSNQKLPDGQNRAIYIRNNIVGQDFFTAMGLPIVLGRGFGAQDTRNSQKVALISEMMAQRYFPNISPIGRRFGNDGPESSDQIEIIGVVKDAKSMSLTEEMQPMAYYPHSQRLAPLSRFVVRYSGSPAAVIPNVRRAIGEVDRKLPIDEVVSFSDHIGRSLTQQKLIARLATFFGLLALMLACIGLYGVMSYTVAQRTNEIGIRMALGARRSNVLWLVLSQTLMLVVAGVAVGLLAALAATRTISTMLYGLEPNDPATIVAAMLLLLIVAVAAGYMPARRAARVDPMAALRED
jgi:predicted permease